MKTSEGRRPMICCCEREIALQLDNQLSWWWQIISQPCKKIETLKKKAAVEKKEAVKKIDFVSCDYNVNQCRWKCVIRICIKSVDIFFTSLNWWWSLSRINQKRVPESNKHPWVYLYMSIFWTNASIPESIIKMSFWLDECKVLLKCTCSN